MTTEGLFTAVPFMQSSRSGYQDKVMRHNKSKKIQLEEADQASDPDNAGCSDQELETTMTKILRALMIK